MNIRIPELMRSRLEFGGRYQIAGVVDELGVAGQYRVRLFDRLTALCIGETVSAADGAYSFTNLARRDYFVVAHDHGIDPKNAAIADLCELELMP